MGTVPIAANILFFQYHCFIFPIAAAAKTKGPDKPPGPSHKGISIVCLFRDGDQFGRTDIFGSLGDGFHTAFLDFFGQHLALATRIG